jgi:uncharacterized protein with HEPN domain
MPRPRDHSIPIDHMLDAISGLRLTAGADGPETIARDWTRVRAIERGFEIVSEASRRIPEALKSTEPDIPWQRIAGIENVLRHDYDGVDLALLLAFIASDLPPLEAALRRMLDRLPEFPER